MCLQFLNIYLQDLNAFLMILIDWLITVIACYAQEMWLFILNMEVGYTKFTVGKVIVVIILDVYISLLFWRDCFF
jgi:hypothetical protein